ncbi:MAG: hypothetical protein WCT49_04720 [Candidatus Paceibacterota bacterium]|jgi:hypothetical protein|nr:hypothetical protein [Candidatus Paceibacterota bacterium]
MKGEDEKEMLLLPYMRPKRAASEEDLAILANALYCVSIVHKMTFDNSMDERRNAKEIAIKEDRDIDTLERAIASANRTYVYEKFEKGSEDSEFYLAKLEKLKRIVEAKRVIECLEETLRAAKEAALTACEIEATKIVTYGSCEKENAAYRKYINYCERLKETVI